MAGMEMQQGMASGYPVSAGALVHNMGVRKCALKHTVFGVLFVYGHTPSLYLTFLSRKPCRPNESIASFLSPSFSLVVVLVVVFVLNQVVF